MVNCPSSNKIYFWQKDFDKILEKILFRIIDLATYMEKSVSGSDKIQKIKVKYAVC